MILSLNNWVLIFSQIYRQWDFKHKQRAHYICVDLGINRYYICA